MRRVVSVLEVAEPAIWDELATLVAIDDHTVEVLDPRRRVVDAAFERDVLPALEGVLVRYARRDAAEAARALAEAEAAVVGLPNATRRVLHAAQRHALDGLVIGRQAWDPLHDANHVRALHGAGLIRPLPDDDAPPYAGRYRLADDLPPPPEIAYDLDEAVMDETDDLPPDGPGPMTLLHDMASLAAALEHHAPKLTHAGTLAVADAKRVGRHLADPDLADGARLEEHPRWGRALRGLHALKMVSVDPLARTLHLDLGLEASLRGSTEEATDRLVHRLVDADLHVVVPAVRAALAQAKDGAVDEVVFLDLLREQHRDVLFPAWSRDGVDVYPTHGDALPRPYDDDGFDRVEGRMVGAALARMARFGLLRRAPGVFAGTADGRRWAGAGHLHAPPVWATSDLELVVPPDAVTPWERFQLERLGRCLQRDTVDRYRLEKASLATWLSTHDVDEAIGLLRRRCVGLPQGVVDTLMAWAAAAQRVVLTRGVVLGDDPADAVTPARG